MTVTYDHRSPYYQTTQISQYVDYLDFWTPMPITPSSSDLMVQLEPKYAARPDLLSYDLYGTPALWWVFSARNPDVIKDPIYDLKVNAIIYAPSKDNLGAYL